MTTRALEDSEIKAIFDPKSEARGERSEHISGTNARRNETLLIVGIGMALRASELVGDVWDGKRL